MFWLRFSIMLVVVTLAGVGLLHLLLEIGTPPEIAGAVEGAFVTNAIWIWQALDARRTEQAQAAA